MRIGLFTDSYLPRIDGIAHSVETFRIELEARGHDVYVIAPAPGFRYKEKSANIIRFPSFKGLFFDDYLNSVFFPPQAIQKIKKLDLDIIHFNTPAQIGLLGAYYALRNNVPLITTYHSDLYEYVSHYPQVLPGTIALSLLSPMITGNVRDLRTALSSIKPERNVDTWNKKIVVRGMTMLHNKCDYVIAPSRKMEQQLRSWKTKAPIRILPTGVDRITTNSRAVTLFRAKYSILPDDRVILFVGRLGSEKNLELLLSAFAIVAERLPHTKLVMVGRHEHADRLAKRTDELGLAVRVIFAGHMDRSKLGAVYESSHLFAFPSRTDTQGLVLHEAAAAGLPIVMIDKDITEIVKDGVSGYFARNSARDFARKVLLALEDDLKREAMGMAGERLATRFSAAHQAGQLEKLYTNVLAARARAAQPPKQ